MNDFSSLAPTLLTVGALLSLAAILGPHSAAARALSAVLCIVLILRYVWWRATLGMPVGQSGAQEIWAWIFFAFESMAIVSSLTVYLRGCSGSPRLKRPAVSPSRRSPRT